MDPEAFLDLANQVMKLKMYPYFDVAHSVLCALHVREDLGAGAQTFSRKHPLSCWLSTMLVIFAGGLLGEPILFYSILFLKQFVKYILFYSILFYSISGAQTFSRKHPLSCWLSTMLVIFAGGMVAGGLLGEPILAPLKNTQQLVIATAVWYVVFYTPFDIGYKASKFLPVKILFSGMKEIYRCKKIHDGVTHAAKLYPSAYIIMIIIGTLKG
ncbi:hypothetical protein M8J76_004418 [Diaphorina citri]|nr:hypothetical protein M8J76_004418 [Diaphorina citri]